MNCKLAVAVAVLALPFGGSLLTKSASAAGVFYQPEAQKPVLVAQRYDDPQNHERQDDWRRAEERGQFHRDEFHHDGRGVWIPGHYKSGFLGIGRVWVAGHWERR